MSEHDDAEEEEISTDSAELVDAGRAVELTGRKDFEPIERMIIVPIYMCLMRSISRDHA